MAELGKEWHCLPFETEEEVVEFVFENLNTSGWEDSYHDLGGYNEPNEMIKQSAEDKKEALHEFFMYLVERQN